MDNEMEYVIGTRAKQAAAQSLLEQFRKLNLPEGTLYVGYPILAMESESEVVDALLTSQRHGLVVFDLIEKGPRPGDADWWKDREQHQTNQYVALTSKLLRHSSLVSKRQLAVPINILTYAPSPLTVPDGFDITLVYPSNLGSALDELPGLPDPKLYAPLNAAIQRVTTIKPIKRRSNVTQLVSRGSILRQIEKEIANLDQWQKQGAIESPDGPQRIRGLAGSGKTVVLALKAAYLHAQHPDWTIAVTYNTRSLHQQFVDLIRRFTFEQMNDEPDWSKVRVQQAWGTPREPGVYAQVAQQYGVAPKTYTEAKTRYRWDLAFDGVCKEVETVINTSLPAPPIYDAILIDEAQDLPLPFFRLAYAAVDKPKRIVWAYDELQNLSTHTMVPPETLFGSNEDGTPRVSLRNIPGEPHQDVILPKCYRNTPWALVTAHALGFGIYRKGGLVQFFDEPSLWSAIGYVLEDGPMAAGRRIVLRRGPNSYPSFFQQWIRPQDALECHVYADADNQFAAVAESIRKNIEEDELDPDDILVIFSDPVTVPDRAPLLQMELRRRKIESHIAGVTTSVDQFFVENSVTISGIYRAKGNEAPMVYVLDSQHCYGGSELIKKRNTLFTAITRSRAWVRLCGFGKGMEEIRNEVNAVIDNNYGLAFVVPTPAEMATMRQIHRDMTKDEKRAKDELLQKLDSIEELVVGEGIAVEEAAERLEALQRKVKAMKGR